MRAGAFMHRKTRRSEVRVDIKAFKNLQIPLPPLEVQKEIVAEVEGYQKVIDGARAVVDNYRPHPVRVHCRRSLIGRWWS